MNCVSTFMESVWNHHVISYFFPNINVNQFSHIFFFGNSRTRKYWLTLLFFLKNSHKIYLLNLSFFFLSLKNTKIVVVSSFPVCIHYLKKKPNSFGGYVLNSNKKRITICMYKTVVSDYNFRDLWLLLMIIHISIKEVPLKRQYSWKPMS